MRLQRSSLVDQHGVAMMRGSVVEDVDEDNLRVGLILARDEHVEDHLEQLLGKRCIEK